MRTTLTIDDDVLHAAKEIGRLEGRTAGTVISEMFRRGYHLQSDHRNPIETSRDQALADLGVVRFPSRGGIVTNDDVNQLREELGI